MIRAEGAVEVQGEAEAVEAPKVAAALLEAAAGATQVTATPAADHPLHARSTRSPCQANNIDLWSRNGTAYSQVLHLAVCGLA